MPFPNVDATTSAHSRVSGSIARASTLTGVDFDYLLAQAGVESSFDPAAKARTSSASGLFQFTEQTWLSMVSRHGGKYGYGWAANAVQAGPDGRYRVSDPGMRGRILNMRFDAEASSIMAAEFAAENRDHLRSRIGREPESVDLYLAHFLGAGGAGKFLTQWNSNPSAAAAPLFPQAARANRNIFYDGGGAPRSLDEIRSMFDRKLAKAGADASTMVAGAGSGRPSLFTAGLAGMDGMGMYDAGMALASLDGNYEGYSSYPLMTPAPRMVGDMNYTPSAMPGGQSQPAATDNHRRPLQMQEIVPMPSRLSVDFARSVYERFSGSGSENG